MDRPMRLPDDLAARLAKGLVHHCVRNPLERFHGPPDPRIDDAEMKDLMIDIVNKVYTVLRDPACIAMIMSQQPAGWNRPRVDRGLTRWLRLTRRGAMSPVNI